MQYKPKRFILNIKKKTLLFTADSFQSITVSSAALTKLADFYINFWRI